MVRIRWYETVEQVSQTACYRKGFAPILQQNLNLNLNLNFGFGFGFGWQGGLNSIIELNQFVASREPIPI